MTELAIVPPEALAGPEAFRAAVMVSGQPALLPGIARSWPLLAEGPAAILEMLRRYDAGREAEIFVGSPHIAARYHYDASLTGFNFTRENVTFDEGLARILRCAAGADPATLYMGSLPSERYLPGIEQLTPLAFVPAAVRPRFWIGTASQTACHYDTQDNVACVAAGRRRFSLFPPEAIARLYVGPIDHTLSGQPISLAVDSVRGDPRFPDFEAIRDSAIIAELEPGDGIFIPKLWWHKVEALDEFNILVNFWWDPFAAGPDQPYAAMLLAMIAIGERPPAERAAWRAWFDHYVFRPNGHPLAFLEEERRGLLGALAAGNYQKLRMIVMRLLRGG